MGRVWPGTACAIAAFLACSVAAGAATSTPRVSVRPVSGAESRGSLFLGFTGILGCTGRESDSNLVVRLKQETSVVFETASDGCRDNGSHRAVGWSYEIQNHWEALGGVADVSLYPHLKNLGNFKYSLVVRWKGKSLIRKNFTLRVRLGISKAQRRYSFIIS